MRIYLVRHAESLANVGASGPVNCELTPRGRDQSAVLAGVLAKRKVARILSSPYRRCLETAEAIRVATGAAAEFWPAVHEHHHEPFAPGPWPLPSVAELAARWPNFAVPPDMHKTRWAAVPEDRTAQWRRVTGSVQYLLHRFDRDGDVAVVVVTHQAPASVFVQAFCQWPNPLNVRVHIDPGSITVLEVDLQGRRHLEGLNWMPDLGGA